MRTDLHHWQRLCVSFPIKGDSTAWHSRLVEAYSQSHRAYHTLQHLEECLLACDEARRAFSLQFPEEVELALWLHDTVYDPRASDNETQSAAFAFELLGNAEQAQRVADLILITRTHQPTHGPDDSWMIDIDLSIFCQPLSRVFEYERQIRQEYDWVDEVVYREKRSEILTAFLSRPRLYQTDHFNQKHEPQARLHLAALIAHLRRMEPKNEFAKPSL